MSKTTTGNTPQMKLELVPLRAAIQSDAATELFVLARVVPPQLKISGERPRLNLGLVLDRSGSMQGEKLRHAKAAATFAIQQLQKEDRVAVTIYDSEVETIVPSTLATNKAAIARRLDSVEANSCTALHDGWLEGGVQVSSHLQDGQLNRVLLLTDGLANEGETNTDRICSDVRGLAERGVSTSTLGVGLDYNEDLLEAMARSGDGNYYFIESAADLERIFDGELQGLMATIGRKVSLGCKLKNGGEMEILNDLEFTDTGRAMLPNLIAGAPIEIVFQLQIPATRKADSHSVGEFRLAYDDENGERIVVRETLSLPVVESKIWKALPEEESVRHQIAHKQATRLRRAAVQEMERGDIAAAQTHLLSHEALVCQDAATANWSEEELSEVRELRENLEAGETTRALKAGKYASYRKSRSR
jgi:Ca-activated chloride channel family protein